MKIFNYSTKPVFLNGNMIEDTEIYLQPNMFYASWIQHNGVQIYNPIDEPRNMILTIRDNISTGGYIYEEMPIEPPDIWIWVTILITFWGFWFSVKILQKLKMR